jgi:hypothetical protein
MLASTVIVKLTPILAVLLCLMLFAQTRAQTPAANSSPPKVNTPASDVLLGISLGTVASTTGTSGASGDIRYHTYWIVRDPSGTRIAATLPGIVVPHGNGFWRLDVTNVCEFDGTSNINRAVIWEAPVGKAATLYEGKPCMKRKGVQTCGYISARLLFASPFLVSEEYEQGSTEECEPRGGRWTTVDRVRKFGGTEELDSAAFIGQSPEDAYWRAVQAGYVELKEDGTLNCPPPQKDQINLANWSISRDGGAWHPFADYSAGIGECEFAHATSAAMPHNTTADTASEEFFQSAKQTQPDLRDIFVSPSRDWALAVIEKRGFQAFEVHEIAAGQLGPKLLALDFTLSPGANHIVSAQWATGSHVAEWTAMLKSASKQGESKPKLVVDPSKVRDVFQEQ